MEMIGRILRGLRDGVQLHIPWYVWVFFLGIFAFNYDLSGPLVRGLLRDCQVDLRYCWPKINTPPSEPVISLSHTKQLLEIEEAMTLGDYPRAEMLIQVYVKQDNKNAMVWYWRGRLYLIREKYIEAVYDFNLAAKLSPEFPQTYQYRAVAYSALGRSSLALADRLKANELYAAQKK